MEGLRTVKAAFQASAYGSVTRVGVQAKQGCHIQIHRIPLWSKSVHLDLAPCRDRFVPYFLLIQPSECQRFLSILKCTVTNNNPREGTVCIAASNTDEKVSKNIRLQTSFQNFHSVRFIRYAGSDFLARVSPSFFLFFFKTGKKHGKLIAYFSRSSSALEAVVVMLVFPVLNRGSQLMP